MKVMHALVIGRFQPFHQGHVYLIQSALELSEKISICIGSANITNEDNPFPYEKRLQMIQTTVRQNNWTDKILHIIPSDDIPDDTAWLDDIVEKLPPVDLIVGNNDWVNGIFKNAHYLTHKLILHNRDRFEGKTIRKLIAEKNPQWKTYVPDYVVKIIETNQ